MVLQRRLLVFASLLFFSATVALAQTRSLEKITKSLYNSKGKEVLVVVHRGDWRNSPENSIIAIENTIAMGADMVEIDIQVTKDGELILLHDKTLERTTNGKGKVLDFTLAQIKQLYLKSGIGQVTNHRVPTLEEALLIAKERILVNIDKGYNHFDKVLKILEKTGTAHQVVIKNNIDYDKLVAAKGKGFLDKVIFMPVINLESPLAHKVISDYKDKLKPVAMELVFAADTSKVLDQFKQIKKSGSRVWVNTLWPSLNAGHHDDLAVEQGDLKNSWDWIIDRGANIIQTDRPKELLEYLRKRNLHH